MSKVLTPVGDEPNDEYRYVIYNPMRDAFFTVDGECNERDAKIKWIDFGTTRPDYLNSPIDFFDYASKMDMYDSEIYECWPPKYTVKDFMHWVFVPIKIHKTKAPPPNMVWSDHENNPELMWSAAVSTKQWLYEYNS